MEEVLICGKTAEELEALKDKHGALVLGEIRQGETTYRAIFKEPSFKVMQATGAISKSDEIKGTIALYDNCIVEADEAIKKRDFLKLKVVESLVKYMNSFSVEVKNL